MNSEHQIKISDYIYSLPDEKIASVPLQTRDSSKLLIYKDNNIIDSSFKNITDYLPENSLLILNNTKVIHARNFFYNEKGNKIEIFLLSETEKKNIWKCLVGGAKRWNKNFSLKKNIEIENTNYEISATYITNEGEIFILNFSVLPEKKFHEIINISGIVPLPPYIKRLPDEYDETRYQTVFSEYEGSVAAPTAGLHFTKNVLENLKQKNIATEYITLHVGAGTFMPVKSTTMHNHVMHEEKFIIEKKFIINLYQHILNGKKLVSCGTTSLRALESIYFAGIKLINKKENAFHISQWEIYSEFSENSFLNSLEAIISFFQTENISQIQATTSILIVPGYKFKTAEILITNFHQPKSTLLLLIAAFIGNDWKKIYSHALQNNYRFLSYGDASLLYKNQE